MLPILSATSISMKSGGNLGINSFSSLSLTSSSLDFPPPVAASFGYVSTRVSIINLDSFCLKVRSAFVCKPKITGESFSGMLAIYSRNLLCSAQSGI